MKELFREKMLRFRLTSPHFMQCRKQESESIDRNYLEVVKVFRNSRDEDDLIGAQVAFL